jgi:hypothetical protein
MKQTAVEWFEKNISKYISYHYDKAYEEHDEVTKIFEQAKEMEKEQIENAFDSGQINLRMSSDGIGIPYNSESYYNETFNTTKTSTHSGLKSLDEHNSNAWSTQTRWFSNEPIPNGIACPKCGNELMDTNPMMTLTSHPAKKNVHCSKCEYKGYRIV